MTFDPDAILNHEHIRVAASTTEVPTWMLFVQVTGLGVSILLSVIIWAVWADEQRKRKGRR